METIEINSEYIELDKLLKWIGVAETGGQARQMVDNMQVKISGKVVLERRKKIRPGDIVTLEHYEFLIVNKK